MVKANESDVIDWSLSLEEVLPDFQTGPLDHYRKQCSFDRREMAVLIEGEETVRFKNALWKKMEGDPTFAHSTESMALDEHRRVTLEKALRFSDYVPNNINPRMNAELGAILGLYDWSVCLRRAVLLGFFTNALRGLGTAKHNKFIHAAEKHQLMGCVAMTEISHGSNTKAFRTRATFDSIKQKFIINTPDFEAAKCWAANLGKTANYAYILAKVFTPDGESHGLHGFVVPIRDNQMNPYPGVIIGDMGEKVGLRGLDNGFMVFNNYEVEMDALLDKTGSVTSDGRYVSQIKDSKKRFSASLGVLSGPRIGIVGLATANAISAVSIAIRYSAVRKQFGPEGDDSEVAVIEYQMQQCRLFPLLAGCYVYRYVSRYLMDIMFDFIMSQFNPDISPEERGIMGAELHAISCAGKTFVSWFARDAVQECREACGGHGYLKAAGIGRFREDGDALLTFEGDNNVLLLQTSNFLLNVWSNTNREKIIANSPFGAIKFMKGAETRLKKKFVFKTKSGKKELLESETILKAYKWLCCYLLKTASEKYQNVLASGEDTFAAKNESHYYAKKIVNVFQENFALDVFYNRLCNDESVSMPIEIRVTLKKLMILYGLWALEKHLGVFYEGGYFSGPKPGKFIRENIIDLCKAVKPEAISLVDALAPPDFILNSCLGVSDGHVYKHLEAAMKQTPGCFEKAKDWQGISERLVAKL